MRYRILLAGLVAIATLVAACTSGEGPNVATESTEADSSADDVGTADAPMIDDTRGGLSSLAGTTWVFDEAFGLGSANYPTGVTFYVIDNDFRAEYGSDCGRVIRSFVPIGGGLQFSGPFSRTGRATCEDLDGLFGYQVEAEIDTLGRLVLRKPSGRITQALRFTHVQSTSVHSDDVPEETAGESAAFRIGRSRWNVTTATGIAVSDLDQTISFLSTSVNADVVSFFAGCNGDSREISWNEDGSFAVGNRFQFDSTGIGEPCTDDRTGIGRGGVLSGTIDVEFEDNNTLRLLGALNEESWSIRAEREVFDSRFSDCFDYSAGSYVDEPYVGTETLIDGSRTSVTFDRFEVTFVETFNGDWDGDGESEFGKRVTLRDADSRQIIDAVHLCGLEQSADDFIRIHPNRITENSIGSGDSLLRLHVVESGQFLRQAFDVSAGSWTVVEQESIALDSPDFLGPITLTSQPLDADAPGDLVTGVIRIRSFGCVSLFGENTAGLVFPLGRTQWDAANTAVIVDGVTYRSGDRIGIRRLPRPEFLEYFNPMERTSCGISNHVIADIWTL